MRLERNRVMKVLVVEGDPSLAGFFKALIENWGHQAERCVGGRDALRMFKRNAYDLVLLEVLLPDMRGDELISRIKEVYPETGFVAMTDKNSRELEALVRQQGILYYMVKPFEIESLNALLEHLSRKSQKSAVWR
ncbi:MAG: response regulator [Proteobacteria bacterium]|nr:response regulator [Pseudomonadota bacterium]